GGRRLLRATRAKQNPQRNYQRTAQIQSHGHPPGVVFAACIVDARAAKSFIACRSVFQFRKGCRRLGGQADAERRRPRSSDRFRSFDAEGTDGRGRVLPRAASRWLGGKGRLEAEPREGAGGRGREG